jgi:phage gp36-like protein
MRITFCDVRRYFLTFQRITREKKNSHEEIIETKKKSRDKREKENKKR